MGEGEGDEPDRTGAPGPSNNIVFRIHASRVILGSHWDQQDLWDLEDEYRMYKTSQESGRTRHSELVTSWVPPSVVTDLVQTVRRGPRRLVNRALSRDVVGQTLLTLQHFKCVYVILVANFGPFQALILVL